MTTFFRTPAEWAAHCNRLLRERDLDNLVLFAGDPGNGKSTLMLQMARLLDPTFSIDRIHFTIKDFLDSARSAKPYQCIAADELLVNRRRSMTGNNMDIVDFLQVCRALNLHLFICFPHAGMLDRAILDHRVRYRIDVTSQGRAQLTERFYRTISDISGKEEYVVTWREASVPWVFERNSGPFWEEYLAKKMSAARQREADAKGISAEDLDFLEAPRKGNRKTVDRAQGAPPKFLSRRAREEALRHSSESPLGDSDIKT